MDQVCGAITLNYDFLLLCGRKHLATKSNPLWLKPLTTSSKPTKIRLNCDQHRSSMLMRANSIHLPLTALEQAYR